MNKSSAQRFVDDDYTVNVGLRANPAYADLTLAGGTQEGWAVLPGNQKQIVKSDRRVANNRTLNRSTPETVRSDRSFLGYRGVRCINLNPDATTAAEHGLDTTSNSNTLYNNIAGSTVPLLIAPTPSTLVQSSPSAVRVLNAAAYSVDGDRCFRSIVTGDSGRT